MQEIGEPITVKKVHPVHKSCFSRIFFGWIISFLIRSSQKNIDEKDIFDIKMSQRSAYLSSRIQNAWNNELNHEKPPSLYKALFRVFKGKLYFYGVYFMIMEFIKIGQPMLIARLVLLFDHPETKLSNTETLTYALVIVLSSFIQVLCNHNYSMGVMDLGMRIRTATCTLIYKKVLRMSKTALRESAVGQMVNLLADDVKRLDDISQNFHHIWMAPIETVIIAGLLWGYVGYTGLIGVAVMVAMTPFQVFLAKWSSKYSAKKSVKSDERVRLISEIISGIQVIKLYTWEKPFAKIVELARDQEIDKIQVALIIRAILTALSMIMSRLAVFTCIAAYVLTGNTLTATYAYTITSFYQHLRITVTIFLPQAILQLYDTRISVNRIKHFLLSEEVTKTPRSPHAVININKSATPTVNIRNANFKWFRTSPHNSLVDITFEATSERLVAVVGTVASGKTTLLHAILNEIEVESGLVEVTGSISYASQEPWLFSGSVRQNIIFGQEYDQQKYEDVIRICSLERDLSLLPKGDGTLVGERGVSLSGGQRARINLARAVYKDADIYLLDDPLSAVDAHVGEQLFKECICGYLSTKCVVLVTHQLQYLRDCRHVYLMESGGIKESGSYEELMGSNSNFASFMANYNDQERRCEEKRRSRVEECLEMLKEYKAVEAEAEEIEIGKVSWDVYKSYLKSGETWFKCLILLLGFILYEVFGSSADCIVTIWVNLEQGFKSSETPGVWMGIKLSDKLNMEIYCTLILLFVVIAFTRTISYAKYCITTSTRLHNNMFNSIVMAPMKFFNDNSSGRIVNRFSKDMIIVDNVVPIALQDTLTLGISVIAISLIIAAMHPYLTIITTSIVVLFYYMRLAFISGSRIVKRVEAAKRSPIYDHLTASLGGMTTIRAVGAQEMLIKEFHSYQDEYSCVNFMSITVDKGFAVLLDAICIGYILCVAMSMLFVEHTSLGGTVGLTITQAIALSGMFQWGIRQWAELETQMTTVERIQEYASIPPELDENPKTPPRLWPNFGGIKFENVSMSYAPDSPYVLKQLSFEIMPQEKVGVVGRTGAGKSSLVQALFRLSKTKGSIWIDGIDTKTISLSNLRSRISIIPQEPVLFSGTLRKNLDPVEEYSDEVLWDALEQVELSQAVQNMEGRLTTKMDEGGTNLSVGQRQLVCLARAIIRNNKILVLDEATANVDPQTDSLIQKTIRRRFNGCTVITIAHRLHTIMDSDKVLVMDAGEVVEFDHPFELLQNEEGMFHGLVTRSGPALRQNLFDIAERNYRAKNAQ